MYTIIACYNIHIMYTVLFIKFVCLFTFFMIWFFLKVISICVLHILCLLLNKMYWSNPNCVWMINGWSSILSIENKDIENRSKNWWLNFLNPVCYVDYWEHFFAVHAVLQAEIKMTFHLWFSDDLISWLLQANTI